MKITKAASVELSGAPSAEQLEKINRLTKTKVTAEDVYVFSVRLCDDQLDRDGERFDTAALPELARLFLGKTGVVDHRWSSDCQVARIFATEYNFPIVGLPGTIDNDLFGTDTTIGYDTALNTIMQAVDKIRDTATSHERLFFIEVMGRDAGFLALNGAIASGAEAAIIPEIATEVDQLGELIKNGFRKSKNSSIVLVAESPITGGAMHLAERVKNEFPQYDVRVSILGHLQRGGSPSAHDRILASRMGAAAIDALIEGQRNVMIGIQNDQIVYVPFSKAIKNDKPINRELLNTLRILSI